MSFPLLYQAHHQLYHEDLDFWLHLAAISPGPILEVGCGAGRVLIPLAEAGIACIGLDIDFGMLKLLKQSLPVYLGASVSLLQADFTCFHLGACFNLILMTCNTFTTLPISKRVSTLECIRNHLSPHGKFVVSVPNPEIIHKLPRHSQVEIEEIFPHPKDGEPVQVSSEWHRDKIGLNLQWHYDHLLSDGTVDRLSIQTTQYLTTFEQLCQEFRSANFQIDKVWGDFDYSDYKDNSPHLIIQVCLN